MPNSSTSQSHANLIREMSKNTRASSRSSQDSTSSTNMQRTRSDFDPENEAIMSTRRLDDISQKLPELRASAQKYGRFSKPSRSDQQPELDFAINTSAIGRAFPDFSQGGSSSDDASISIEIGRGKSGTAGGKQGRTRSTEHSLNQQLNYGEDSLEFSNPTIDGYEVMYTPPLNSHKYSTKPNENIPRQSKTDVSHRRTSALRNEMSGALEPATKARDSGSSDSAKGNGDRRGLASMHARVRDEDELSHVSDERPPTVDLTAKNTRFGNTKTVPPPPQGDALPTRFSSMKGLVASLDKSKRTNPGTQATTNPATQQSFGLPDMPNISELISGIYEDGTPVFSRHGKSRTSRFNGTKSTKKPGRAGVGEIPLPQDEQAIFLSLKLLQDKVSVLEKEKAETRVIMEDLQQRNEHLEAETTVGRRVTHRTDSALGTSESEGGDERIGGRKGMIERNRLESSIRALQSKLDAANRKSTTAESILQDITQERDSAVSQLSVAYVTIEQLKAENEDLRAQIGQGQDPENSKSELQSNPVLPNVSSRNQYPQGKESRFAPQTHKEKVATVPGKDTETVFDFSSGPETEMGAEGRAVSTNKPLQNEASILMTPSKTRVRKTSQKPYSSRSKMPNEDTSKDLTFLSFLDSAEVANLRRTLEQERIDRKQRKSSDQERRLPEATISQQDDQDLTRTSKISLPRKSSMKDLTFRSDQRDKGQDATTTANSGAVHNRHHSENSVLSTRSRRRPLNPENMTSAFIVPDITIRRPNGFGQEVPKLSTENKAVLEGLARHSGENCSVCMQNKTTGGECSHLHGAQRKIKVPKPVPVSERQPSPTPYEEEPTLRPSQEPGLALATVIKTLEDEIVHLKIELGQYQALYNGHDPALSKRRRKLVLEKIDVLIKSIDTKSDQIYALYDVLEGQKKRGDDMSEQEVEMTLQSIGLDAADMQIREVGGASNSQVAANESKAKPSGRAPWDLNSDDGSEDDLPWEGIESTVETTTNGYARGSRRTGVTA